MNRSIIKDNKFGMGTVPILQYRDGRWHGKKVFVELSIDLDIKIDEIVLKVRLRFVSTKVDPPRFEFKVISP